MTSHRRYVPLTKATSPNALTETLLGPEERAIGRVAQLIDEVVARLDGTGESLQGAVAECNAALEVCLEAQREPRDRGSVVEARRDLTRLARLLVAVDPADAVLVMRQVRKVLGRFDARAGAKS